MIGWGTLDERGVPPGHNLRPFELSPRDADRLRHAGRAYIIDCRTREEWETVHLEGSHHIPLDELEQRIDEVQPDPDQSVLVICHHGRRSVTGVMKLSARGVPNAKSVFGGLDLWAVANDPSLARYTRDEGGCHVVKPPDEA